LIAALNSIDPRACRELIDGLKPSPEFPALATEKKESRPLERFNRVDTSSVRRYSSRQKSFLNFLDRFFEWRGTYARRRKNAGRLNLILPQKEILS
jgi:hypothetical protein